jgi:hypothetical protein
MKVRRFRLVTWIGLLSCWMGLVAPKDSAAQPPPGAPPAGPALPQPSPAPAACPGPAPAEPPASAAGRPHLLPFHGNLLPRPKGRIRAKIRSWFQKDG